MKAQIRTPRSRVISAIALLAATVPAMSQLAQTDAANSLVNPPVVPQIASHAGVAPGRAGETVEMVFKIYSGAEGGDALWSETQRVSVGEDGKYSVLLGSATDGGLPQAVFAGGAARWLGVSIEDGPEQARAPLASVAYAMKAADAETLAGVPAAEFVTQRQFAQFAPIAQLARSIAQSGQSGNGAQEIQSNTSGPVTGSGTAGIVPLWTGALTQGNSTITQVGTDIGINEAAPGATLDVNGTANFRGTTTLPALSPATAASGYRSQVLDFSASAWSSTASAPVAQTFRLYSAAGGNDTATPYGTLTFQFQNGTAAATNILSIASSGVIGFAPTQNFPGTIKSVTATSPITAATASGAVNLGLNSTALETTLNGVYPRLGAANTFVGNQAITGNLTASGTETVQGAGTFGANGTTLTGLSAAGTTTGVSGTSSSTTTGAAGVSGSDLAATGTVYGVSGSVQSPTGAGVYGINHSTTGLGWGVLGVTDSTATYAAAVSGQALSTTGVISGVNGNTLSTTNGASGVSGSANATSGTVYGVAGYTPSATKGAAGVSAYEGAATGQVYGLTAGTGSATNYAAGIFAFENAATGNVTGVNGSANSSTDGATGVYGSENATSGKVFGVSGTTNSATLNAAGVQGYANNANGLAYGVKGDNNSTVGGAGVYGGSWATTGYTSGVNGYSASTTGNGVTGAAGATTGFANGVWGTTASSGGNGVFGSSTSTTGGNGVNGATNSATGSGVTGNNKATSGYAVGVTGITSSPGGAGVQGFPNGTSGGIGVFGWAPTSGTAVLGLIQVCTDTGCTPAAGNAGVFTTGAGGTLLLGTVAPSYTTEFKVDASGNGFFGGDLNVTGKLTKGSGSFKIDDPLDPANKYLSHSFVESPDMMNVYNGNIVTDKRGLATVVLPDYFEALNRDFRYQLTVIGQFAQAIVSQEIEKNHFVIRTSKPGVKVSWQVTGIRQDAYANANRIPTEEDKPANEQGYYLHPEVFGQPASKSIMVAAKSESHANDPGVNTR